MPTKNSSSGPQAAVTEQDLLSLLPQEVAAYKNQVPQTQQTIRDVLRTALDTWGHIYHALVWLAAAKDLPGPNSLLALDANNQPIILNDSHIVPAFTASEGGSDVAQLGGLIFGLKHVYEQDQNNPDGGLLFQEEAYQAYIANGVAKPLLQHFLDKYRIQRDNSNLDLQAFDPDQLLTACRDSATVMTFHSSTAAFIGEAVARLGALWGGNSAADLIKVNGWVEDSNPAAGSRPWLDNKLDIANLNVFALFFDTDNADEKKALGNARLALALNREIYGFVYNRFVDLDDGSLKSDGLEQVITIATSQLSAEEQRTWLQLLAVTYGAIAVKIFAQTEGLINQIKTPLP